MSLARNTSLIVVATALLALSVKSHAQTAIPSGDLSLFRDYDMAAPGVRAFSGAFGRYGVAFVTSDGATRLHAPGPETRISPHLAHGGEATGSLSLIGAYTVNQFRVAVDIRRDQTDLEQRRSSTELGVGFIGSIMHGLSVGGGPTIGFGDVTPSRSPTRPGVDRSYGLNGEATLSLSDNWALTGVLGYRARANGAREESFFSVLGLGYRF